MVLKVVVEKIEDVPESLREHYVPSDDGKFRLDGVEDTSGLKSALEKERQERKSSKEALARFKDIDPEKYFEMATALEKIETDRLAKKGDYEKMLGQVTDKHKTELEARDKESGRLRSALEKNLIDAEATRAIAGAKGAPELLLPHVRQHVKVVEEDGEFVARVVGKDGTPRIGGADGSLMTIEQLVAEMRNSDIYGRAFEGTGASGSGASNSGARGGQKTISRADFNKLDPAERASIARDGKTQIVD